MLAICLKQAKEFQSVRLVILKDSWGDVSADQWTPLRPDDNSVRLPGLHCSDRLILANRGQSINRIACFRKPLERAASCHSRPFKCHPTASNKRRETLSTPRWTFHQADADFPSALKFQKESYQAFLLCLTKAPQVSARRDCCTAKQRRGKKFNSGFDISANSWQLQKADGVLLLADARRFRLPWLTFISPTRSRLPGLPRVLDEAVGSLFLPFVCAIDSRGKSLRLHLLEITQTRLNVACACWNYSSPVMCSLWLFLHSP